MTAAHLLMSNSMHGSSGSREFSVFVCESVYV